jgi:hypothetical protein
MFVELQFGTRLLRPTLKEAPVNEVVIEQLDAAADVPLRSVCWLDESSPGEFESALAADRTVAESTQVVETDYGTQYEVTYAREYPGTEMYAAAVEEDGIFITGRTRGKRWTVQMRFPDEESFSAFRDACRQTRLNVSVEEIHEHETAPHAEAYGISGPQREILLLATECGYFEVPRESSLADLAEELDVSSQAASERLRRGLDSLVEHALLTPE